MYYSIRKNHPLIKIFNISIIDLPAPINISIWWNYGSLLGLIIIFQLITGILLSIHYCRNIDLAFSSIIHIMRNIDRGWFIRYIHANSASLFFIFLYIHIGRGIYYNSFLLIETWNSGIILFILSIATAFLGYVLPWGQIRFWGATVITNLLSTIPYSGTNIVEWIWGGFSIRNPTLTRFFSIHFILPFIIILIIILHLLFLHQTGSNNPLGFNSDSDRIIFHPYYRIKDFLGFIIAIGLILYLVIFLPNIFNDTENFIPANSSLTPTHIKPEWYFLWIYAILRSIPNKLGGVIAAFSGVLIITILPVFHFNIINSLRFYPINKFLFFYILITPFFLLTWLGGCPVKDIFVIIRQASTTFFFLFFLLYPIILKIFDLIIEK